MDLEQLILEGASAATIRKLDLLDYGYRIGRHSTHGYYGHGINSPGPTDWGYRLGQYSAHAGLTKAINPGPGPWQAAEAASFILSALGLKAAAAGLESPAQKVAVESQLDAQITQIIDEYCGTGSPHIHGPLPGTSLNGVALASELALLSASLQAGELQKAVLGAATTALQQTIGAAKSE
jgi:hypothetical protein